MMRMSDKGLVALARHEGIVPGPYRDAAGVWTYGVGHTAAAGAPDPAQMPRGMPRDVMAEIGRALRLFRADVERYEDEVRRAVTVPLSQHEFDALVSFHYNTGGIARASATELLNAGHRREAGFALMNWSKPESVIPRRRAERDLFLRGEYPRGPIPVWRVDEAGRIDWSAPYQLLGEAEALALLRQDQRQEPPTGDAPGWLVALVQLLGRLVGRA